MTKAQEQCVFQVMRIYDMLIMFADMHRRGRLDRDLLEDATAYLSDKRERYIRAIETMERRRVN